MKTHKPITSYNNERLEAKIDKWNLQIPLVQSLNLNSSKIIICIHTTDVTNVWTFKTGKKNKNVFQNVHAHV